MERRGCCVVVLPCAAILFAPFVLLALLLALWLS